MLAGYVIIKNPHKELLRELILNQEKIMNNEWELKKLIVEIGKRIWMRGYVASNDGNITVKLNDDELLTTPTGVSKGFMDVDMIIKADMQGKVISGNPKYKPSSELRCIWKFIKNALILNQLFMLILLMQPVLQ